MAQPVGILGGTFDPVHNAHVALARAALRALALEQVLWIPTGAPGYRKPPVAPAAERLAMLRRALAGEPRFVIDERELKPGASGFTYDTVAALKKERPDADFVLLMGADQYAARATWHRWPELEKLCRIAVAGRPGSPGPDVETIPMKSTPTSSSEIRDRLGRNEDVSGMVPAGVLEHIRAQRLYA